MRRPRTVEITNDSVMINTLDISDMVTKAEVYVDADCFPRVILHSSPDVLSFTGSAMVDDPRLNAGIGRHDVAMGFMTGSTRLCFEKSHTSM